MLLDRSRVYTRETRKSGAHDRSFVKRAKVRRRKPFVGNGRQVRYERARDYCAQCRVREMEKKTGNNLTA